MLFKCCFAGAVLCWVLEIDVARQDHPFSPDTVLTLKQCIDAALRHNTDVVKAGFSRTGGAQA